MIRNNRKDYIYLKYMVQAEDTYRSKTLQTLYKLGGHT